MAAREFPTIKAIRSYVIDGVGSGEWRAPLATAGD
jgi:hypothetical protein